jgi:hypothetical protein
MAISRVAVFSSALILAAAMGVLPTQGAGAQSPPTTFVGIPPNNATVSGTSQLLDAGGSSGATLIQYEITGGTLTNQIVATAVPTIFGWIALWNTTAVANGSYSLQSVASFSGGVSATSAPITVVVNNAAPSAVVIVPASGAVLDATKQTVIDAIASPGVTAVTITVSLPLVNATQVMIHATPTIYGWIGIYPAVPACDPFFCSTVSSPGQIQAEASSSGGLSGASPIVNVTFELPVPNI